MKPALFRKFIRLLILESAATKKFKMIFLAGLPGSGKSTLLQQLGIEDQFTNCNIDNCYEPYLKNELGTSDLHTPTERYVNLKRKVAKEEYQMTPAEQTQYDADKALVSRGASLFGTAISEFKSQVDEVCSLGANFIIDGTSANYGKTSKDLQLYLDAGYDCAMIMVDIDVETSQSRNLERGKKGKRSIWNPIIYRQSKSMTPNIEKYAQLFGPDRFFLVSNRGTFGEFKEAIEAERPAVQAFMESK